MKTRVSLSLALVLLLSSLLWMGTAAHSQNPAASDDKAPAATSKEQTADKADDKAADKAQDKAAGKVLATFKGGDVTVTELEESIARQSPFMRKRYTDPESLRSLLDKTVRFALLAREAERKGFGDRDAVKQAVKQNAVQQLMRTEFDERLSADSIPEEDVKKYYEDNIDEYVRPATRRASHIMVATEDEAKALITELKDKGLSEFRSRARDKSLDEATKNRGGDLRYFDEEGRLRGESEPSLPLPLVKAAFSLKERGEVYKKPIKLEGGFSVLMLTGERDAVERKLKDKDLQQSIRVRLWRERRQQAIEEFVQGLRKKYKPEIHPELLGAIEIETEAAPKGRGVPEGFPEKKTDAPEKKAN